MDAHRYRLPQRYTLDFGRLDRDYFIRDVHVNIDGQENLARATYNQMEQLTQMDLPIAEDDFVRVWKTLILKRIQDIFETEKCVRADHFVRITRSILLPAPLADLLYSLGMFLDTTSGITYHVIPPNRPAQPQPWWTVDAALLAQWITTTHRMSHLFTMKEYPSIRDTEGRPLVLTAIQDANGFRSVKAISNQPTPADGLIRFVNDELFQDGVVFNDCHLRMTEPMLIAHVRFDYLRDYCIGNNV